MLLYNPMTFYSVSFQMSFCAAASILIFVNIVEVKLKKTKYAFINSMKMCIRDRYEGSLALGATHERSVFKAVLPAASSGITAAVILGVGRAVGETMAIIMVAGNQAVMPSSLIRGVRTLTANIVMEMGYATDLHRGCLLYTSKNCANGILHRL